MRTIGVGFKVAISLLALTSFSILLSSYSVYAEESSVSTATVTINQSCSMVGTTNTAHTATLANGTYSGSNYPNGIGQTTLKVFCNDNAGFAIYAIGYTGNEYGNTKLHSSTLGSTYDINTGVYNSSSASSSTWSMKLTSVSGTYAPTIADGTNGLENFTTWHTIPTEYTKVAYRTSTTDADNNGQGTGSSLTTTYDAYVSATQPAGTYIGQVKYTLVHPNKVDNSNKPVTPITAEDCPGGWVCYAPNSGEIIGSMDSLSSTKITSSPKAGKINVGTSATTINLIAPNYKRTGYGFAGWSTDFEANNSSTIYGPNETLTVPSTTLAEKGMILYPVWIASTGNLQGWNGCSSLADIPTSGRATLASMTALKDTRDNNVYTVAKLADGKCWMTENLRLNNEATIATANTNHPLNNGTTVTLKNDYTNNLISNKLSATSDTWCSTFDAACFDQTMLNTNNTNLGGKNASGTDLSIRHNIDNDHVQWYSYGNYYNWYSATAGNGTYSKSSGNVDGDLCPTGWHLPYGNSSDTGNTAGGFYYLGDRLGATADSAVSSVKWRAFPNNFIYSGRWDRSSAILRGSNGSYWSSSASDSYGAYSLYFVSSNINPGTSGNHKFYGFTVRCVAGGSGP